MVDVLSAAQRSELMSRIQSKNTVPELLLRRAVWAFGVRYRVHRSIGRIKPDMVFGPARIVVFVDGCFWHQCPLHGTIPKSNVVYWKAKLERNIARDIETTRALTMAGWKVIRFWEHEVYDSPERCARRILKLVTSRCSSKLKKIAD
jgi:DNA mismatch endonuclease (patch repair protein)